MMCHFSLRPRRGLCSTCRAIVASRTVLTVKHSELGQVLFRYTQSLFERQQRFVVGQPGPPATAAPAPHVTRDTTRTPRPRPTTTAPAWSTLWRGSVRRTATVVAPDPVADPVVNAPSARNDGNEGLIPSTDLTFALHPVLTARDMQALQQASLAVCGAKVCQGLTSASLWRFGWGPPIGD
jgi:hypothetical protein